MKPREPDALEERKPGKSETLPKLIDAYDPRQIVVSRFRLSEFPAN
jgi:hypothetical protein